MTTRYTEKQIEDVASILRPHCSPLGDSQHDCWAAMCGDFADLFAADNPLSTRCGYCGEAKGATSICTRPNERHSFGGFDRDGFLTACGLESEG